jgi:hypothetical protein
MYYTTAQPRVELSLEQRQILYRMWKVARRHLRFYRNDFRIHDYESLCATQMWEEVVWIVRDSGTDFCRPGEYSVITCMYRAEYNPTAEYYILRYAPNAFKPSKFERVAPLWAARALGMRKEERTGSVTYLYGRNSRAAA